MARIPKLIVFDLDHTLWPFKIDECVFPFRRKSDGRVVDGSNTNELKLFPEVLETLQTLRDEKHCLAVASRIKDIAGAYQVLHFLQIYNLFTFVKIYPGYKIPHFRMLQRKSGIDFVDMLFFDDDRRNLRDVKRLGVTTFQVIEGINKKTVENGFTEFANKFSSTSDN
ncbi:magnesium-dependent phosphatase 1 isoform X1 [Nilaparvata lugens]|uniref:magnesium-dependent phosphatase 1 isoform X1 n=1 Tax=Nilaparvata lugens TaxID=108931 RepID=UPI00193CFA69|nr:magnesium-dependent phosphatase 1 isoform X1 [Nilaparvata lugens]